ncbi:hypothetical protein BGZ95_011986 [Linnemannia exigua]|uniref:FAD-binding domain-containing protein n=1 Tax=Linnemannia exigua TaxID=604196 RepID=A0AAD4DJK2_9FUNG|nr:hypothetical protein BGZ95_011986 [Linnemannia exigua]
MTSEDKPTVLIVGAGLGGLMLAALLEKSGFPYTVFERATTVKPLGSAMSVGPTLLPLFQQMGIYDELLTIGKYITHSYGFNESLEPTRPLDLTPGEEYTGYGQYIIARPKLYDLILQLVPVHKIHFGHRVLNITEDDDRVTVHLSNSDKFEGDIVVGADGAYSAVRQRMYEQLKTKGMLPKADQEDLPFSCTCLVGQTNVLDPEKFPLVALPRSHYNSILAKDKPFSTSKAVTEQRFRNTNNAEWGAHPAQSMCDETRDFPLPLGGGKTGTLGDLYDSTPKELLSKVMLEEKVFETWYHGRVVLLGDACHKLNPAGGHGAVTAMHDAIALANLLYAMPTKTSPDITKIFDEYHKERLPAVMESFNSSQQLSKIFKAGRLVGAVYAFLATFMPVWVWRIVMAQIVRYRPQVGFIKRIEPKGTIIPVVSPSEQKARDVFEKQQHGTVVVTV